ncbi:MAG: Gfo/Idh/MocA family oxidoreductase [Lentisphaerae bacterium]|nr:Gfo/Idh/MocA family oxidoreductase [Lentisphaerota bacterium]
MSIKVALIGVGGYGYVYMEHLCRLVEEKRIELIAAAEVAPEKCLDRIENLEKHGAKIVKDAAQIYTMEPHCDLICLPVGIESHAPLAIEALKHNCNVMVEKPLAGSMSDVQELIAARNAAGRFVAVGFQHSYEPGMHKIKQLLLSGVLGSVKKIKVMGRWARGNAYYQRNNWAGKELGRRTTILDSPFCNAFAHYINLALFLAGTSMDSAAHPEIISGELSRSRDIEMFDTGIVRFQANGADGLAMFTHCCAENCAPQIVWECSNGMIKFTENSNWQVFDGSGKELTEYQSPCQSFHRPMFDAVINRINNPEQFICTPEIAQEHVHFITELHKKAAITTLPETAYTIRESDGVRINNGLAETWDKIFQQA